MAGKRLTHCRKGHELTEENTEVSSSGRRCRMCKNARQRSTDSRPRQCKNVEKECQQCGEIVLEDRKSPFCLACSKRRSLDRTNGCRFGITGVEYRTIVDQAMQDQNGKCMVCGLVFVEHPHFDHDHETGEFRGLLCGPCNWGVGCFYDNPDLLINAALYLINNGKEGMIWQQGLEFLRQEKKL